MCVCVFFSIYYHTYVYMFVSIHSSYIHKSNVRVCVWGGGEMKEFATDV